MNPAIEGYTAAVLDETADLRALAAEMASIDRLIDDNAQLDVVLTDTSVPGRARRAVLEDLLEGRVSHAARRLAGFAAGAVPGQKVPAAISWVATKVRQLAEGEFPPQLLLGHRGARQRVGGYATAVFEETPTDGLDEVEDELFRFARTVTSAAPLRFALGNADLPPEVRRGVVDELLDGKVQAVTRRLVDYAITGGRPRDFVGTLDWLVQQTAVARGWRVARVRSGQEIDAEERRKLETTLSRLTGTPVDLQVTVDPALLAGVNVEIGDLQLDATARGRLERLREHVAAGGWSDVGFGRLEHAARTGAPPPPLADKGDAGRPDGPSRSPRSGTEQGS